MLSVAFYEVSKVTNCQSDLFLLINLSKAYIKQIQKRKSYAFKKMLLKKSLEMMIIKNRPNFKRLFPSFAAAEFFFSVVRGVVYISLIFI